MKKAFRRITAYCLAVVMLFSFTTALSFASGGSCGDDLRWDIANGALTISGSGEMYDYTPENEAPWYEQRFSISSIVIKEGVTSIGSFAFAGLEKLVTADCGQVESIGDYAFYCCPAIDSAVLGDNLIYIGIGAFADCGVLSETEIPLSVETIGDYAFMGTSLYGRLIFGDALREIGDMAFYMCYGITEVEIPDSVRTIGDMAFYNCEFIESVEIGRGVNSIGEQAFAYCTDMKSYSVASRNSSYTSIGDALYTEDGKTLIAYPIDKEASVSLSSGVSEIADAAFAGSFTITSVALPNGLRVIGDEAFANCWYLESIEFPNSLESIGDFAFLSDFSVTELTVTKNVSYIGAGAFADMSAITDFSVSSSNSHFRTRNGVIYDSDTEVLVAFPAGRTGTYSIPSGVEEIADYSFCGSAVEHIEFPGSLKTIGEGAFNYCGNITSIELTENVESIGDTAFAYCYNLNSITVPHRNTHYTSQNSVLFTEDMTTLIAYPVAKSGTSYTVPNGVTEICDYAFEYANLRSVTIPDSVEVIGDYAFSYCDRLSTLNTGSGLKEIGVFAFSDCYNIREVTLPRGLKTLGAYAFAWSSGIEKVTFEGAPYIDMYAFAWCTALTDAVFKAAAPRDLGEMAFYSCGNGFGITHAKGLSGWTYPTWMGYDTDDGGEAGFLPGDVSGDGQLTNSDLVMVARFVVGITSLDEAAADVDGSGRVTNADIVTLARILVAG